MRPRGGLAVRSDAQGVPRSRPDGLPLRGAFRRTFSRLRAPAWVAAIAGALGLIIGHGVVNYDAVYSLVWGQQLSRGESPRYDLPFAPTPHPLPTLIGLILSPLGAGAAGTVLVVTGYLALGALGYLAYRLGAEWFGPLAGLAAAGVILTREPVLLFGAFAYDDFPYLVLVLGAMLVETRQPKAGLPVLLLLGVAGLIRPEAWLFSACYLAWLGMRRGRGRCREGRELAALACVAATAPVLWALDDLLLTGDPLWSLTVTRHATVALRRPSGLTNFPSTAVSRLDEVLSKPVLVGAAIGGLASLARFRARALLGAVAGIVAMVAFAFVATADLPIISRFALLPAVILALFYGAALFGWRNLSPGDRDRGRWIALGAAALIGLIAFTPSQVRVVRDNLAGVGSQQKVQSDLVALIRTGAISLRCGPLTVPGHPLRPLLAVRLGIDPGRIIDRQFTRAVEGTFVTPNSPDARLFTLNPVYHQWAGATVPPPGFTAVAGNRSWLVYERCGRAGAAI